MNQDGTPIEGAEQVEPGAGTGGGEQRATATEDEARELHKSLGIKSTFTADKSKKRPSTTDVRNKDVSKKDDDDSDNRGSGKPSSSVKPKATPDSDKDGDSGNGDSSKKPKERKEDGEVSGESEEAGDGVHKAKSRTEEDSEQGGEGDADDPDSGARQREDESGDAEEEGEDADDEGKRPGKSNPKIEQRFQKLTNEVKERDEVIEELQQKLEQATRQQFEEKTNNEDPQYTVEDFKKVRDEEGNIHDLDDDQAELAFRRWQDGYTQRAAERDAQFNQEQALAKAQQEYAENAMRQSVEAYDTLTGMLDSYPELDVNNPKFDQELSDQVMPLIEEMIEYHPGTEPGNENGVQPVIAGMRMKPNKILDVINSIRNAKRTLPLNGLNDTVDTRSNVSVPHSRSSDPVVNQANQLMKDLKINKRF